MYFVLQDDKSPLVLINSDMTLITLTAVSQGLSHKTEILKGSFQLSCISPKVTDPKNKCVLIFQMVYLRNIFAFQIFIGIFMRNKLIIYKRSVISIIVLRNTQLYCGMYFVNICLTP
jgi:hypothetical protein